MADWLADRLATLGFESYPAQVASAHWRRVGRCYGGAGVAKQ
jgi:hypothetical protein